MHELSWTLAPPADFNKRCSELEQHDDIVSEICALTDFSLTVNHCNRLNRQINKLPEKSLSQIKNNFTSLTLGIVSNATIDLMVPALVVTAFRHGVYLKIVTADFDQVAQEAFDPNSVLNQAQLDLVLISLDYRAFEFASNTVASSVQGKSAEDAFHYLNQLINGFKLHSGVDSIIQTLAAPPVSLMGNIDVVTQGTLRREINKFNQLLIDSVPNCSHILFDIDSLASEVGTVNWFDERQWLLSRVPMANHFIPLYADKLARIIGAVRGKSKKCLVLDLDNTLWGGVIGDDGLDGIVLGQGNPRGEAHLAVQQWALELKDQGVVLAVCSKNDHKNAILPFNSHPDMLLKESDIAVFVANWENKASNLRYIAETLNIGLDSLVFVDDNPAERDVVRQMAPQVSVPELPKDVALYVRTLNAAGYFEMLSLTEEDNQRAKQYTENSQRNQMMKGSEDINDYLFSLEMNAQFNAFDDFGRKRITQLINKTNQFNLTTKRYTEAQVEQMQHDNNIMTLQVRLKDKFGDNGMISVVICKKIENEWHIDSWLMSCRVIKRKLEEIVCDEIVKKAKLDGILTIVGYYQKTAKNNLVENHYQSLGFEKTVTNESGQQWLLNVEDYKAKKPPISVVKN